MAQPKATTSDYSKQLYQEIFRCTKLYTEVSRKPGVWGRALELWGPGQRQRPIAIYSFGPLQAHVQFYCFANSFHLCDMFSFYAAKCQFMKMPIKT